MRASGKTILHMLSYSVSANIISLLVSIFLALFVPKVLGIEEYSYWQLYLFYTSYVGFFQFGWCDGIYLRYGGKYYYELNKSLMSSQYWLSFLFSIIICISLFLFGLLTTTESSRFLIIGATGINCFLLIPRGILQYLLQGTGRIDAYAQNQIFEKGLHALLILIFLILGFRNYTFMIIADLVAKTFAMFSIIYICRDIVFSKLMGLTTTLKEAYLNISVGIKLMFANIAGMLIIGIVRFAIEHNWDINTFGKVSFSLTMSNFILVFISAISIVLFPIIRRCKQNKLPLIYNTMGTLLSIGMICFLIFYYPIKSLLVYWLPNYTEAISYFSILFPISLFETRNSLLINTYLKALGKENALLWLNVISVCFSLLMVGISVLLLQNLFLAILSIVILLSFRCFISDLYLQRHLNIKYSKEVLWDIIATIISVSYTHLRRRRCRAH